MNRQSDEDKILNEAFLNGAKKPSHKDDMKEDFLENLVENDDVIEDKDNYLDNIVFSGGGKRQSDIFREKAKSSHIIDEPLQDMAEDEAEDKSDFVKVKSVKAVPAHNNQIDLEPPKADEPEKIKKSGEVKKPKPIEIERIEAPANPDGKKKEKMSKGQKIVMIVLLTILIIILAAVITVFVMHNLGKKNTMAENYGDNFRDTIVYNGVTYHYNPNMTSVAFMGVDREVFGLKDDLVGTAGQSDVNMVVAINTETGRSDVILIPRDTLCDIDKHSNSGKYIGTEKAQLCLAYSYGDGKNTSCDNTITSIQRILYGIPINTYVALNMEGISELNDCVGGVTVTCPNNFRTYEKGEQVTLHGEEAETFIRSREHTLAGDAERRERQISYVKSYVSQAAKESISDFSNLRKIYDTGKDYTVTNLTLSRGLFFGTTILSNPREVLSFDNIETLKGELKFDKLGYAQTVLDDTAVLESVLAVYYLPEE